MKTRITKYLNLLTPLLAKECFLIKHVIAEVRCTSLNQSLRRPMSSCSSKYSTASCLTLRCVKISDICLNF